MSGDSEHHVHDHKEPWYIRLYLNTVLGKPWIFVTLAVAFAAFFGFYIKDFTLNASSDAIVLENDKDLRYYDYTREVFGSDDYIIVTVTPREGTLVSDENIARLAEMSAEFEAMPSVQSVTSILNVPLFHSPDVPLMLLADGYKTLADDADRSLALEDLTSSPLYTNYLISEDGKTTAIQVTFNDNPDEFTAVEKRRRELRDKRKEERLTADERAELKQLEQDYAEQYAALVKENNESIEKVREIVARYQDLGALHIGGVPMIMADIISYVRGDIITFGYAVTLVVIVVLALLLRRVKWVLLPTAVCLFTVITMIGYMGYTGWAGTIVTSNFPSLLFVIALADVLHVTVHYRELYARYPDWTNRKLVLQAARDVALPCFYTTTTTMVGFGSLIVSGIRPVMDFGLIMAMGVVLAFVFSFSFFPAGLILFPKGQRLPVGLAELKESPLVVFGHFTERHRYWIIAATVVLLAFCAVGASRLEVENRFIDYFHKDTEIYQGMSIIDQRLGGTTPLEIVLEANPEKFSEDELRNFWLKEENREIMNAVHTWFEDLPDTGKVLSPVTMERVIEKVNDGKHVPTPVILLALQQIPTEIEEAVVGPYLSSDRTQVRFATRVQETDQSLSRKDLMATIHEHFETSELFADGSIEPHATGVFVLYNNMLQSLYDSQIATIGAVFGVVWLMFLMLFRSLRIATIAIMPNVLPIMLVLGTLGWSGTPLDLMTIMTAAITLGLAVDFAIHYVHRFKHEFREHGNYVAAMYRTNNSIGRALYYTTITIVLGFSILTFSHFIPSIYFGLFTSLSIVVAFLAAVTILPLLFILWKPLGPETSAQKIPDDRVNQEAA
jgi:uncharacterized protein